MSQTRRLQQSGAPTALEQTSSTGLSNQRDPKTVLTFGVFDLFHPGHQFFLTEAAKLGDRLVVIIARDANVLNRKGQLPVDEEDQRRDNVQNFVETADLLSLPRGFDIRLGYEDWSRHLQVLDDVQPDMIALGYDQLAKLPDGPWQVVRIEAFKPETYKSSLLRSRL